VLRRKSVGSHERRYLLIPAEGWLLRDRHANLEVTRFVLCILHLCMYVCIYVCVCVYVCMCMYVFLFIYLFPVLCMWLFLLE
jgi:hypothetical protein